jgi:hypothetical protein
VATEGSGLLGDGWLDGANEWVARRGRRAASGRKLRSGAYGGEWRRRGSVFTIQVPGARGRVRLGGGKGVRYKILNRQMYCHLDLSVNRQMYVPYVRGYTYIRWF